ncbi:hypothetical protein BZA05DRAFT_452675, partial [Tricharina praecox]|uniref:uncharacterized protein n=1 Tax=Tricharina praecox TaxID=43433 RepID=UPI00222089F2
LVSPLSTFFLLPFFPPFFLHPLPPHCQPQNQTTEPMTTTNQSRNSKQPNSGKHGFHHQPPTSPPNEIPKEEVAYVDYLQIVALMALYLLARSAEAAGEEEDDDSDDDSDEEDEEGDEMEIDEDEDEGYVEGGEDDMDEEEGAGGES